MRVIFDAGGAVLEQNDYYAFGEKHQNGSLLASNNRFKYNGKELQTTGDLGLLDYGARMYDAKLGRTLSQDLLQEDYYGISSYAYCFNDPVRYVDVLGLAPGDRIGDIGTVNINEGRGNDFIWVAPWLRQLGALRDGNKEGVKQNALEALKLLKGELNGLLSKQAYDDYLKDGGISSYLKLIGSEILGQWTNPELVVGGLSMGIAGLQVVNSPLKPGAGATATKGAQGSVKSNSYNFSKTAEKHMGEKGRHVPMQILDMAITGSKGVKDIKGGSRALVHETQMVKNGKIYKLEVLYDKQTNTIWHFKYE